MGKGPKETFFQRYTNGQQVPEKMLNVSSHQENPNQNHNHLTPVTISITKKKRDNKCWQRWGEKGILAHCWCTLPKYTGKATMENNMEASGKTLNRPTT